MEIFSIKNLNSVVVFKTKALSVLGINPPTCGLRGRSSNHYTRITWLPWWKYFQFRTWIQFKFSRQKPCQRWESNHLPAGWEEYLLTTTLELHANVHCCIQWLKYFQCRIWIQIKLTSQKSCQRWESIRQPTDWQAGNLPITLQDQWLS